MNQQTKLKMAKQSASERLAPVVQDWEQIGDYSWASLEVIDGEEIWVVANLVAKKKFDIEEALEDYQDHIETERRKIEEKNKKNTPEKLELNKYCKFCRKTTKHKETKK